MAELGADLIKTFYAGDKFYEVIENTPVPVFTIGAEKLNADLAVLKKAYDLVQHNARDIIFGRNIFTARDPKTLIKALTEVINKGQEPKEVASKYKSK